MTQQYKILGQVNPLSATNTILYQVPINPSTQAVCSTLTICNMGATSTYRIAVSPVNESINAKHYLVLDSYVNQYDSSFLTLGISLSAGDQVTVFAGTTGFAFSLFGIEIT